MGEVFGHALAAQGRHLTKLEQTLSSPGVQSMSEQLQPLAAQTSQVMAHLDSMTPASAYSAASTSPPAPLASPAHHLEPKAPPTKRYDGTPESCCSFLTLCSTECSRVAFMITHLTGRAQEWATAEWERRSSICDSVAAFPAALGCVFGQPVSGREAARALGNYDQDIRFCILAAESQWNGEALADTFFLRFSEDITDRLTMVDLPTSFEALVELAIKVDNRLQERERLRGETKREVRQRWR